MRKYIKAFAKHLIFKGSYPELTIVAWFVVFLFAAWIYCLALIYSAL